MATIAKVPEAAITAWRNVIGPEAVITEGPEIAAAETATFETTQRIPVIIQPGSTEEVAACVAIANEHRTPIYTVSSGKNWGYGSRVPVKSGCVLMELHRMNKILEFDEPMGTITVQPGVSFRQVAAFLEERGSAHFVSAPGTSSRASLIGNVLDRGWGFGPYSDRFDNCCAMEVVLADGSVINTGFSQFKNCKTAAAGKWGVGPWFDGMFTQSNLGVVTRMTFFLAPLAPNFTTFVYNVESYDKIPALIDGLRNLRQMGVVRTNFKVQNFYRILMERQQYPWDVANGNYLLDGAQKKQMKQKWGIGEWNGFGALYCWSQKQANAEKDLVRKAIGHVVDGLIFLDKRVQTWSPVLKHWVKWRTGMNLDVCLDRFLVSTRLCGVVKVKGLKGAYWRMRTPPPTEEVDLDKDRVGFVWVDPVIPLEGQRVKQAMDIIDQTQTEHGFDFNVGLNCVTERSIFVTGAFVYDRNVEGMDDRVMKAAHALVKNLDESGFPVGRATIATMEEVMSRTDPNLRAMQAKIKKALDPNGILSPGRYELQ